MTESVYEFQWVISEGGYGWVDAIRVPPNTDTDRVQPFLTQSGGGGRLYRPLEKDGLYLEFAQLQPSPKDILRFARRFGQLGITELIGVPREGGIAIAGAGERLSAWQAEIDSIKVTWTLWKLARDGARAALAPRVVWEDWTHPGRRAVAFRPGKLGAGPAPLIYVADERR